MEASGHVSLSVSKTASACFSGCKVQGRTHTQNPLILSSEPLLFLLPPKQKHCPRLAVFSASQ